LRASRNIIATLDLAAGNASCALYATLVPLCAPSATFLNKAALQKRKALVSRKTG
jgi:hypothetical protein